MLKFTIESIDAESIMDMLLEKFSIHGSYGHYSEMYPCFSEGFLR